MLTEIKEWFNDWKELVKEDGIFTGMIAILALILLGILFLPFSPFYILNEWSKSWFK